MNRMPIGAIIIVSIAFGGAAIAQNISDAELVSRVLKAKRISEIPFPSTQERDKMNFLMGIPARLFSIAATTTNDAMAWQAIHHFNSMTDAGLSESFDIDCLEAMNTYPLIFFNRYLAGDDLALKRMNDALNADWTNGDGTDINEERIHRKAIEREVRTIQAMKGISPEKMKRQNEYLTSLQKDYELRKKRFRDAFGELR